MCIYYLCIDLRAFLQELYFNVNDEISSTFLFIRIQAFQNLKYTHDFAFLAIRRENLVEY